MFHMPLGDLLTLVIPRSLHSVVYPKIASDFLDRLDALRSSLTSTALVVLQPVRPTLKAVKRYNRGVIELRSSLDQSSLLHPAIREAINQRSSLDRSSFLHPAIREAIEQLPVKHYAMVSMCCRRLYQALHDNPFYWNNLPIVRNIQAHLSATPGQRALSGTVISNGVKKSFEYFFAVDFPIDGRTVMHQVVNYIRTQPAGDISILCASKISLAMDVIFTTVPVTPDDLLHFPYRRVNSIVTVVGNTGAVFLNHPAFPLPQVVPIMQDIRLLFRHDNFMQDFHALFRRDNNAQQNLPRLPIPPGAIYAFLHDDTVPLADAAIPLVDSSVETPVPTLELPPPESGVNAAGSTLLDNEAYFRVFRPIPSTHTSRRQFHLPDALDRF